MTAFSASLKSLIASAAPVFFEQQPGNFQSKCSDRHIKVIQPAPDDKETIRQKIRETLESRFRIYRNWLSPIDDTNMILRVGVHTLHATKDLVRDQPRPSAVAKHRPQDRGLVRGVLRKGSSDFQVSIVWSSPPATCKPHHSLLDRNVRISWSAFVEVFVAARERIFNDFINLIPPLRQQRASLLLRNRRQY